VYNEHVRRRKSAFPHSKKALAIPVTYLILFVSLIAVISATYSFAAVKISARGAIIRATVAKQNMQFLDDAIHSVAWSFGATEIAYMDDCGGTFQIETDARNLLVNLTDEQTISDVLFNSSIGKASYELASESSYDNLFIRGDERAIINQSSFTMTQLYAPTETDAKLLILSYRPLATAAVIGTSNGKPLNIISIHIINLNSSQSLMIREKFYLKVASLNVTTTTKQYEFNQSVSSLALKAVLGGIMSTVWLPISSNEDGATVNVEIVTCSVQIQEAEV
jgi:hypothetical protein